MTNDVLMQLKLVNIGGGGGSVEGVTLCRVKVKSEQMSSESFAEVALVPGVALRPLWGKTGSCGPFRRQICRIGAQQ